MYIECPYCGASLDPGEACDCGEDTAGSIRPDAACSARDRRSKAYSQPTPHPPQAVPLPLKGKATDGWEPERGNRVG